MHKNVQNTFLASPGLDKIEEIYLHHFKASMFTFRSLPRVFNFFLRPLIVLEISLHL